MTDTPQLALLASGAGSNVDAVLAAIRRRTVPAAVACVVTDNAAAGVRDIARQHGASLVVCPPASHESRRSFETRLVSALTRYGTTHVMLLGWMRMLGAVFLETYGGRTVNLHPSLLPAFPGLDAVGQALRAGVDRTGVTIHWVDHGMDTGPIIAQEPVPVRRGDNRESLQRRIQRCEHRLVPQIARQLVLGEIPTPFIPTNRMEANHGNGTYDHATITGISA